MKVYCVYQVQGDTHGAHDAHEAYDTRVFLFVFIKFCLIPFALVTFQGATSAFALIVITGLSSIYGSIRFPFGSLLPLVLSLRNT